MRPYFRTLAGLLCLLPLLVSCDDFLEVPAPDSQLNSHAVFQDYSSASAALTNIYASIRDQGLLFGDVSGCGIELGCYTDELQAFGGPSSLNQPFYNNNVLPSNSTVASWWSAAYTQIYAANALLEGVAASDALNTAQKDQLAGEALFVRSLLHFYLLSIYGDIPYATTTDYRTNSLISRTPTAQVYGYLETDLSLAMGLLPPSYPDAERTRPNASVARALLARVYLYDGKYEQALEQASQIIGNTSEFSFPDDISQTFLKGAPSTIWQLLPRSQGRNTYEGAAFILVSAPPATIALTDSFMASFEPGDLRRENWVSSVTDGTTTYYFPYKYKQFQSGSESSEYSIIFRLSEQYLIRAEARAQLGDLAGAKEDVDFIRANAGLPPLAPTGLQGLVAAILTERRSELFTEFGHRFFDLKRSGLLDTTLTAKTGWQSTDRLLPLPENELLLNGALTQNPGY